MSDEENVADKMYEIVANQYHKTRLGKFQLTTENFVKIDSLIRNRGEEKDFDHMGCVLFFISKLISHNER